MDVNLLPSSVGTVQDVQCLQTSHLTVIFSELLRTYYEIGFTLDKDFIYVFRCFLSVSNERRMPP